MYQVASTKTASLFKSLGETSNGAAPEPDIPRTDSRTIVEVGFRIREARRSIVGVSNKHATVLPLITDLLTPVRHFIITNTCPTWELGKTGNIGLRAF
jgi:hypothetical protein